MMKLVLEAVNSASAPVIPEPPPYILKNPEIMQLEDYRNIPEDFWSAWPKTPLPTAISPIINVKKFRRRMVEAGVDPALLNKVLLRLEQGAELGAQGAGRLPAVGKNLSGFYDMGAR